MFTFLSGVLVAALAGWAVVLYYRQNARLLSEEKERLEQEKTLVLEFMHNLVEGVGEESSRHDLHQRIIHAAVLGTGAVSGCLFVPAGERKLRAAAVEGLFPPPRPLPGGGAEQAGTRAGFLRENFSVGEVGFGEGVIGEVAATGKPVLVNDAATDPRVVRHEDPALRVNALLAVPMFFRKRFLGVIALANSSDGMGFSETDFSLVASLGEQAALAIHNADQIHLQMERQRLDLDLSLAANVQGMLLPRELPEAPGFEVAAVYETAQRVGGDLYNVIGLPGGRLGLVIADVSGKGVAASLLMAICQTAFVHIARSGAPPGEVLSRVNREILEEIRADMFVTMVYAVVDPAAGEISIARAGHELPVLLEVSPEGRPARCRTVESEGMAIGMVPPEIFDPVLEPVTVPFRPGQILVLYTDGITERTNRDGVEFSTARLMDAVRRAGDRSAADVKDYLLDAVERFTGGGPPADDMTLLVLKAVSKVDHGN